MILKIIDLRSIRSPYKLFSSNKVLCISLLRGFSETSKVPRQEMKILDLSK